MKKIAKIRLNSAKSLKNLQKGIKIILIARNLQTIIKTTLKIIQYHNQTTKQKITKKRFQKAACEHKISFGYRSFHTSVSRSFENSGMNKKPLFSLQSSILLRAKTTQIFHAFHFLLQNSLQLNRLKKGVLQYSSSSRKKDSAPYNSLNCKKQEHYNSPPGAL